MKIKFSFLTVLLASTFFISCGSSNQSHNALIRPASGAGAKSGSKPGTKKGDVAETTKDGQAKVDSQSKGSAGSGAEEVSEQSGDQSSSTDVKDANYEIMKVQLSQNTGGVSDSDQSMYDVSLKRTFMDIDNSKTEEKMLKVSKSDLERLMSYLKVDSISGLVGKQFTSPYVDDWTQALQITINHAIDNGQAIQLDFDRYVEELAEKLTNSIVSGACPALLKDHSADTLMNANSNFFDANGKILSDKFNQLRTIIGSTDKDIDIKISKFKHINALKTGESAEYFVLLDRGDVVLKFSLARDGKAFDCSMSQADLSQDVQDLSTQLKPEAAE